MLHGARGSAASAMSIVADAAEAHGIVVLAPDSRGGTWDVIRDDYGEDVAFIDRALGEVFQPAGSTRRASRLPVFPTALRMPCRSGC